MGVGLSSIDTWRLFVALPVPAPAAIEVGRLLGPYVRQTPGARWLRSDLLHVTLRFLGATPATRVAGIAAAMGDAVQGIGPFEVTTTGGDGRMHHGEGVAWLRLGAGVPVIQALADRLAAGLEGAGRSSEPHLTVARRADATCIATLRTGALGSLAAGWIADRVVLYRSRTGTPAGSSYEGLAEVTL